MWLDGARVLKSTVYSAYVTVSRCEERRGKDVVFIQNQHHCGANKGLEKRASGG